MLKHLPRLEQNEIVRLHHRPIDPISLYNFTHHPKILLELNRNTILELNDRVEYSYHLATELVILELMFVEEVDDLEDLACD